MQKTSKIFRRRWAVRALLITASLIGALPVCQGKFVGQIVSQETGKPVAATVRITDEKGKVVEGEHSHVDYLQLRWCYVDGEVQVARPNAEGLSITIRRGLETIPLKTTIAGESDQTFQLKRWIDMKEEGYMSGDTHVHFLELDQCHLQMRAEDLEVLNLLTSDFTDDAHKFTGDLDLVSTLGHWVYVGQEFRDWQQGHINLLRLRELVKPVEPFGGTFRDNSHPHMLVSPAAREARAQDAAVTWAHFGDIPGAESPIAIALGLIDAVDLISQGDPTKPPLHWEPWRMDQPEHLPLLESLAGIELYYQYLNSGFQIPMAAGTDKMSDRIPVGSSRLYVHAGGDRTYDAWIEGLKLGNGFITNGPMLTFSVDDYRPGKVVKFGDGKQIVARCTARSLHKFERLEIIVNGQVVATETPPVRSTMGIYESTIKFSMTLEESSWVAARVAARADEGEAIMPRRMKVFAHANPIYFLNEGRPVRVQASIDYLRLYLRYSEHWFSTAANFGTEGEKELAMNEVRHALRVFEGL